MVNAKLFSKVEDGKCTEIHLSTKSAVLRSVSRRQHCLWVGSYFPGNKASSLRTKLSGHLPPPPPAPREFPRGVRAGERNLRSRKGWNGIKISVRLLTGSPVPSALFGDKVRDRLLLYWVLTQTSFPPGGCKRRHRLLIFLKDSDANPVRPSPSGSLGRNGENVYDHTWRYKF